MKAGAARKQEAVAQQPGKVVAGPWGEVHAGGEERRGLLAALREMFDARSREPYPSTYKFDIRAPWPQPSPWHPTRMAPTVLHVPPAEVREFLQTVVKRYVRTLGTEWPLALRHALTHPRVEPVPDAEFCRLLGDTPFSRFLNPTLDPADTRAFAELLRQPRPGRTYFKADFSAVEGPETHPDVHVAPSVTLFSRDAAGRLEPLAIRIRELLLTPGDGEAWELAKHFALQGAALTLLIVVHPTVHFPMDSINAVTRTVLPRHHVLARLLEPHRYIQLPLNYAVLYIERSIGHGNPRELYTAMPYKRDANMEMFARGYGGIEGNSSYPAYRFTFGPPAIPSGYGTFLKAYYDVIREFVSRVTRHIPPGDADVVRWADALASFLPGFPSGADIFSGNNLAEAASTFIHTVAVVHSADHYAYSREPLELAPLCLRVPPPTSKRIAPIDRTRLRWRRDAVRHWMAWRMYFEAVTMRRLVDVDYGFEGASLDAEAATFRERLRQLDAQVPHRYIPLEHIASSIQY